ncbi:PfkB family carbohydrate kinase [Thermotoga sp. KOL6]|uniref:PfkB family carbohydrate kinase n=1 Tax=Thermotoga sp. KOL6 TaxID=126741 RepID=UPI000C76F29B|nr:PfkB family carbohydrate kinase [Thermotoga sp. KOL6]PLV60040.1 hypothetical protein AS005_01760 [Thermotoga sp. KOL6]
METNEILKGFENLKILVVGDFFLDKYYIYDPKLGEPSLETGITPIVVTEYEPSPGAAGNVAKNMAMLGAKVYVLGIIGDDEEGRVLLDCLKNLNIETSHMIVSPQRVTRFYTKFFNSETMKEDKPRIDRYDFFPITKDEEDMLIERLNFLMDEVDSVLLIDQYETGKFRTFSVRVINHLRDLKRKYPKKLFIADSRKKATDFLDFCMIKCNIKELSNIAKEIFDETVEETCKVAPVLCSQVYGKKLFEKFKNPIVITLSNEGAVGINEKGCLFRMPSKKVNVIDVCGAGDAFTSCFVLNFLQSRDFQKALDLGINCGSICVQQPRTGKITWNILLDNYEKVPFVSLKNENTVVLNFERLKKKNVKVALFDFDGTISLLRRGWESVMKEVMVESIMGNRKIPDALYRDISDRVDNLINRSTGVRTSIQMKVLEKLVRGYGLVPEKEILPFPEYKKIYTKRLKEIVKKRMREITNGKKKKQDYLVEGIIDFLRLLKNKGIKLFLASGTDKSDVVEEAKFLEVYDYFDSLEEKVNERKEISKREIIERIVNEFNLNEGELLVVGDGPVEIMIGWKYKALTLGVACDEYKRNTWDMKKVERLLRAKADVIIPNYSICFEDIKSLIFGR